MEPNEEKCESQKKQWLAALATTLPMATIGSLEAFATMNQIDDVHKRSKDWTMLSIIIGCIIGAIFGSVSADIFGRKKALFATTICAIGGIIGECSTSIPSYCMILLIEGFNTGITRTIVPLYITEIADAQIRGKLLMLQLVGTFTGQIILKNVDRTTEYWIIGIGTIIIPIIFLIAILWFPETPYHLISKKQYEAAEKSLSFFKGIGQIQAREKLEIIINTEEENDNLQGIPQRFYELFRGKNRKGLIIIAMLIILQCSRIYFNDRYDLAYVVKNSKPPMNNSTIFIVQLILSGVLMLTIDIFGRRLYLLGSTLIGLTIASFFAVVFMDPFDIFIIPKFIDVACQVVISGVIFVLVGELFLTNVRSIASAMVMIFGIIFKVFTMAFNFWLPPEITYNECFLYILIYLLAFVFVFAVVPETKKKTFQEIQNALADQNRFKSMYTTWQGNRSKNLSKNRSISG